MKRYAALVILSGLSYVAAFATQLVISHRFGASADLDAYWAALSLANLLAFFAYPIREAIVPEYHRLLVRGNEDPARYLSHVLVLLATLALSGTAVAAFFSVPLGRLMASDAAQAAKISDLLRFLAPGIVLFAAGELLAGLLVPFHRIVAQAAVRLLAAGTMFGVVWLSTNHLGAKGIASGFVAMQAVAVIAEVVLLLRAGVRLGRPLKARLGSGTRAVLIALLLAAILTQTYGVLEREVFITLRPGLASAYQYAIALVNTMLAVFGATLTALLWPRLLDAVRDRTAEAAVALTALGLRTVVLVLAPMCTFLFVMAEPTVALIYGRGAFDAAAVQLTSTALRIAVFGAIPVAATAVLVRLMVSTQSARGLAAVGVGIAASGTVPLIIGRLTINEAVGMLHWPISNFVGMVIALGLFRRYCAMPRRALAQSAAWSGRLALACLAMAGVLSMWPSMREGIFLRTLDLVLSFAVSMAVYGCAVWVMRLTPARLTKAPLR